MSKILDLDAFFPFFGIAAMVLIFGGLFAGMFYEQSASRTCRENVAKLETPRTAAEIAVICK